MNLSRPPLTHEARERQAQADFMQEAVHKVEKYFGQMCNDMGNISRKTARLRDKYDHLAKTCLDYASAEQGPLNKKLTTFAEQISNIQDYRQAEIERLQAKVIDPLLVYGRDCKHTKTDLNKSLKARKQEELQHQKVVDIRNRSHNDGQAITRAEADLQKKTLDVARSTRALEETVDKFEVKKIHDLKNILSEFVKIEMLFHAKALEVYSHAYNDLIAIDEEEHIEVFRNSLRPSTNLQERMELARAAGDLSLDDDTPSPRPRKERTTTKPQRKSNRRYPDEDEDEEYDDDDDIIEDDEWGSEEETDEDSDYDRVEVEDLDPNRRRRR